MLFLVVSLRGYGSGVLALCASNRAWPCGGAAVQCRGVAAEYRQHVVHAFMKIRDCAAFMHARTSTVPVTVALLYGTSSPQVGESNL